MCDTFVALPDVTRDGSVIFGKNSDREPNEAHQILLIPAADHPAGSQVKCTYISIPQAAHTYAVLLAKPFWIWGAEMGANEHGVVIGNEAVFSRIAPGKEPGLIGMDFLRLALERAQTAEQALHTITALLETYGQSGNCAQGHPTYYHNSFLIADPHEAWVLETVDRQWAAERVRSGVRSISNAITIGNRWDLASAGLVTTAIDRGWCRKREDFDFARCYSDFVYTTFSAARPRQSCTTYLLRAANSQVDLPFAFRVLRAHGTVEAADWRPDRGITGADVCCHAGFGPIRISQTTGSMASRLKVGEEPLHWLTGTSAPCTGIFKPVWLSAGLPDTGPAPTAAYDTASLWWQHERLHRVVLGNYPARMGLYRAERDALEASFLQAAQVRPSLEVSASCFEQAAEAEATWLERVRASGTPEILSWYHRRAWEGWNCQAGLPACG